MTSEERVLRKEIAGLFIVRISGHSHDHQRNYPQWELNNNDLKKLIDDGLGGVIVWGGSSLEIQKRSNDINKWSSKPMFFCADVEEGIGQRFDGGTWLTPPMALNHIYKKDPQKALIFAQRYGQCIGKQARRCGINLVLGPICDINSNKKNPVINVRAWGEDPLTVSNLISKFYKGISKEGVLSCAKHFPGHGDTDSDSHLVLPEIDHDLNRLNNFELVPFRKAIDLGIESIMTAHIKLKNLDQHYPASLSKKVVRQLLRKDLKFEGLILTDALMMDAISKKYNSAEAAVLAFEAGADIILMPENPFEAIEAIYQATISGRISIEQIKESLDRKDKLLSKVASPSIESYQKITLDRLEDIEEKKDRSFAKELIINSLEVHHNGSITNHSAGINFIRIDSSINSRFLSQPAPAIIIPEAAGYKTIVHDPMSISPWDENQESPLSLDRIGRGPFIIQLFSRGNPFRGDKDKNEPWKQAIKQLQSQNLLNGLFVYGNPYLWEELCCCLKSTIPAGYSPGQMREAQEELLKGFFQKEKSVTRVSQDKLLREFTD